MIGVTASLPAAAATATSPTAGRPQKKAQAHQAHHAARPLPLPLHQGQAATALSLSGGWIKGNSVSTGEDSQPHKTSYFLGSCLERVKRIELSS